MVGAEMRRRDNPYTPGSGRTPHTLAGRDDELTRFRSLLEGLRNGNPEPSLIYTGLRGVGKTALLGELDIVATEAGWATTDVREMGTKAEPRAVFTSMALSLVVTMGRRYGDTGRIDSALNVVKGFADAGSGSPERNVARGSALGLADSGDLGQDLAALVREIGRVARDCGTGALLVFDEMQCLDADALATIGAAFQAVSRTGLPVALVGAGQPNLRASFLAAKPYADRLFTYAELGGLSEMAARSALIAPAAAAGITYDEAVVGEVVNDAAGLPHLIQVYGSELWNFADAPRITMADLEAARVLVRDALARGFFGTRLDLGTGAEQRYLSAMASLGPGPYPVAAVALAFGVEDQRRVSVHRDALMHKGLIWSPRRGQVDFTVPLMAEFLKETPSIV